MNTSTPTIGRLQLFKTAVLGGTLLIAAALMFSTPATAHNAVVDTIPADGDTVTTSPVDIVISTSDELLDLGGTGSGFAIVVRDASGLYYGDGCVDVGSTDMGAIADLGEAGEYTVTYRFVSADGHSLSDSFGFSFDPSASHTPVSGSASPPQCGVGPDTPTSSTDAESPTPGVVVAEPLAEPLVDAELLGSDEPQGGIITVAIAGVLVAAAIALLVWLVRRRNGS